MQYNDNNVNGIQYKAVRFVHMSDVKTNWCNDGRGTYTTLFKIVRSRKNCYTQFIANTPTVYAWYCWIIDWTTGRRDQEKEKKKHSNAATNTHLSSISNGYLFQSLPALHELFTLTHIHSLYFNHNCYWERYEQHLLYGIYFIAQCKKHRWKQERMNWKSIGKYFIWMTNVQTRNRWASRSF